MTGPQPPDVDVERVVAEITEEADRRRASGEIAEDELAELEATFRKYVSEVPTPRRGAGMREAIREAESRSFITHFVTTASERPLLGGVKKGVRALVGWYVGAVASQTRDFGASILHAMRVMADRIEDVEREHQELRRIAALVEEVEEVSRTNMERSQRVLERLDDLRLEERLSRMERMLRHFGEKVDGLARGGGDTGRPAPADAAPPAADEHAHVERGFDYYLFQHAHRGGPEALEERVRRYLPYFAGRSDVLDFGCGKGEFMEALAREGVSVRGVDVHPEFVAYCRERGLDVAEGDGVEYLRSLADASLGGVFAGQVVEHLHPRRLVEFVEVASDKLAPGGVLLCETVNPTCLGVFSHAFYIDLSHDKPVHPTTMRFLMESSGFIDIEIEWMFPFSEEQRLDELDEGVPGADVVNRNVEKLNQLLYGPHDYAIVGRKP